MIWNGGMSFHGGCNWNYNSFSLLFANKYKLQLIHFIFLDLVSLAAPIGIFFGRIANFINSELIWKSQQMPSLVCRIYRYR